MSKYYVIFFYYYISIIMIIKLETRKITREDKIFWWENITKDERTWLLHTHKDCKVCNGMWVVRTSYFQYCDCVFWEIEREKVMGYYKSVWKPFKKYWDTLLLNAYIIWFYT